VQGGGQDINSLSKKEKKKKRKKEEEENSRGYPSPLVSPPCHPPQISKYRSPLGPYLPFYDIQPAFLKEKKKNQSRFDKGIEVSSFTSSRAHSAVLPQFITQSIFAIKSRHLRNIPEP